MWLFIRSVPLLKSPKLLYIRVRDIRENPSTMSGFIRAIRPQARSPNGVTLLRLQCINRLDNTV